MEKDNSVKGYQADENLGLLLNAQHAMNNRVSQACELEKVKQENLRIINQNKALYQENQKQKEALKKIIEYKNRCYIFKVKGAKHFIDFQNIWDICSVAEEDLTK